jgi:hypothetical protein
MLVKMNIVKSPDKIFEFVDINTLGNDQHITATAFLLKAAISVAHYNAMRGKTCAYEN